MSSSNQPLRHGLGISMVLVLYVNTNLKLIAIKQRDISLCFFLCFDYHIETVSPPVFRKLLTYLSVWSKLW